MYVRFTLLLGLHSSMKMDNVSIVYCEKDSSITTTYFPTGVYLPSHNLLIDCSYAQAFAALMQQILHIKIESLGIRSQLFVQRQYEMLL